MSSEIDLQFLNRTVVLSHESFEAGGFPVAAILVRDSQEISFGLSSTEVFKDATAHAEIQAIRAAGMHAVKPLTLYSSLEPCMMCLAASAWAGVNRIVFGCSRKSVDPSYYTNDDDIFTIAKTLRSPPEIVVIPNFDQHIIALVREYEGRLAVSFSGQ